MRSPSVQGARRSAPRFLNNAGVLEPYIEHGEQAQRSHGTLIACFDRQVARKADQKQAPPPKSPMLRGGYTYRRCMTTILVSVISSTAYLGPSLPKPLSFSPP